MESKDKKRKPFTILDLLKKEPDTLLEKLVDQAKEYQVRLKRSANGKYYNLIISMQAEGYFTVKDLPSDILETILKAVQEEGSTRTYMEVDLNGYKSNCVVEDIETLLAERQPVEAMKEAPLEATLAPVEEVPEYNTFAHIEKQISELRSWVKEEIKDTDDYVMNLEETLGLVQDQLAKLDRWLTELTEKALKQMTENGIDLRKVIEQTINNDQAMPAIETLKNELEILGIAVNNIQVWTKAAIRKELMEVGRIDYELVNMSLNKLEKRFNATEEILLSRKNEIQNLRNKVFTYWEAAKDGLKAEANFRKDTTQSFQNMNGRVSDVEETIEGFRVHLDNLQATLHGGKYHGLVNRVVSIEKNFGVLFDKMRRLGEKFESAPASGALGWMDFAKLETMYGPEIVQDFNTYRRLDDKIVEIPKEYTNKDGHRVTITEEACRQILEYLEDQTPPANPFEPGWGEEARSIRNDLTVYVTRKIEQAMDRPVNKILEVEKRFEDLDQVNQANFNTIEKAFKTMSEKVDKLQAEFDALVRQFDDNVPSANDKIQGLELKLGAVKEAVDYLLKQDKEKPTRIKKFDASLSPTLQKIFDELAEAASNSMKS